MSSAQQPVVAMHGVHKTYRLGQHVIPALQGVDLSMTDLTGATLDGADMTGAKFGGASL